LAQTTPDEPQTSNFTNPNLNNIYKIRTTKQKILSKMTNITPKLRHLY